MDIFMWSIPFVSSEALFLLEPITPDDSRLESKPTVISPQSEWWLQTMASPLTFIEAEFIRLKVLTVARFVRMLFLLRDKQPLMQELKALAPNHKIPYGSLIRGESGVKKELMRLQDLRPRTGNKLVDVA
eukprot:Protomagalhaensia_sp_Gyna_25__2043@NODE_209_length_4399_cov_52_558257_g163_i0_p5_GENE_NODE_209_length_4399_cov_52_558257_g163_i0NODE_209_length_4399_cov_52_558257_g163_i0_p5_ORF_typecomplete_len130_score23_39_NODE_209_length_4399_cov_52_558257_g163_i0121510